MSTIYLGQLSPGEIQIRERESLKQRMWGGGVTLAEKLGFVFQFKPGDMAMLIDAYNQASAVRCQIEGSMDWGAYTVKVLEGPRAGESLVINWAAVTPIGPGFTESKQTKLDETAEVLGGAGFARHGSDQNGSQVFKHPAGHIVKLHPGGGWTHVGHATGEHGMDLHKHLSNLGMVHENVIRVATSKLAEVNAQRKADGKVVLEVRKG
jgi:hypothetical protein